MKKYTVFFIASLALTSAMGQTTLDSLPAPVDGYANLSFSSDSEPFDYPQVKPQDVRFFKRIWRDIRLQDEKNKVFATPGGSLMETLLEGIQKGKIAAYDPVNDSFKYPLTAKQALARLVDTVLVPIFDKDGNQIDSKMQANDFNPERVVAFRIKEDVFFDKVRSKVETRIVGIAPVMSIESNGQKAGEAPVFWLYFPHCRSLLVKKEISDADRDILNLSFDDLFLQRRFTGRIVKESNPTDQRIVDYVKEPESQEKEAKRIETAIEDYKTKMWGYSKKF